MIDSLINFYKNIPYLLKHVLVRFKEIWIWFVAPFVASIIILLIMMLVFKMNNTEEIKQARAYYRLAALTSFSFMWITIYQVYLIYKKDYFISKLYNINPIFQNIIITIASSILMFISLIIIIFATPVNIESSVISTLYYVIMALIFMVVVSTSMGLISILTTKLNLIYYIISAITFFIVPIIFIPTTNEGIVTHILMLNPVYYLIEGVSQSVVLGALSLNNLPYHIYFYLFIGLLCVIIYALYRTIANKKYIFFARKQQKIASQTEINDEDSEAVQNSNPS
ncbi:sugar ABC transporter permease [Staphylococcus gallinarum]|uniref:sugar ABC transporter permease n=1 Tax=Staphylococcus gallinarum TaxID=1293 RepID=UPI001E651821|nr:sugar ABC transporter permease [Staphylococcus gallinarum]MCD8872361.1 sugar ABC transporter permease [Staphylococcus gallinarum]MCW0986406.1 sugar ABC transporter permease [Staphylococcus gallinarum]